MADIARWNDRLSALLLFDAAEIVEYLFNLSNEREIVDYLDQLLGPGTEQQRFVSDFVKERFPVKAQPPAAPAAKKNTAPAHRDGKGGVTAGATSGGARPAQQASGRNEPSVKQTAGTTAKAMGQAAPAPAAPSQKAPKQKKTQYKHIDTEKLESRMIEGRHLCDCMAAKHKLVGNCLACGRVVCAQEGPGPCLFCGAASVGGESGPAAPQPQPTTKTAIAKEKQRRKERLDAEAGVLQSLGRSSSPQDVQAGYEKAVANKDKLLQFDREHARRTRVIDDEMDWFDSNSRWLSKGERDQRLETQQKVAEERARNARRMVFSIDLDNRRLTAADPTEGKTRDEMEQEAAAKLAEANKVAMRPPAEVPDMRHALANPLLREAPVFVKSGAQQQSEAEAAPPRPVLRPGHRVQDPEIAALADHGMCLSMHQPWASLLTAGIKTVEGRPWPTNHRGILWIAATVRAPSAEEVRAVEDQYRHLYSDPNLQFPAYPTACLLGYVVVTDCLTQEQYQKQFSQSATQESQSAFVFVCEQARELPVKLKMTGDHKIYRLDPQIHKAAKQAMRLVTQR